MYLKIAAILLIASLGAIGIAGFWSLDLAGSRGAHTCPFSRTLGAHCPSSILALALHHLSGLQELFLAIINFNPDLLALFFLLAALLFVFSRILPSQPPPVKSFSLLNRLSNETAVCLLRHKFFHWHSLRYKY